MARRRGALAALQHQMKVADQRAQQAQRNAVRAHDAAVRQAVQAQKQAERAAAQAARATEAERKAAEKEAQRLHVEAMLAEVDERNTRLAGIDEELSSLLASTLQVDDYVDLERLRVSPQHPSFDRTDLETPTPEPEKLVPPQEPVLTVPPEPKGLGGVFKKKQHAEAVAAASAAHAQAMQAWQAEVDQLPARQQELKQAHAATEEQRLAELQRERARYQEECAERDRQAAESNQALDQLIANLGYGTAEAIEEYMGIVLSNSVYPEAFPVEPEDYSFDPATAELRLRVIVPGPETLSDVKAFRYVKASDEITASQLSQKAQKNRYSAAVQEVALRSLHEVFEADRRGLVQAISLEVGANIISPATGQPAYVPFVAVAAQRESFLGVDLAAVVPLATLEHLGAAVSKNPHGLTPIDPSGVRRS
jgi:restriction system protein